MKANLDKFQFIILGNTGCHTLQINNVTIKSTLSITRLTITVDLKLNFTEYINNIIKKSCYKLHVPRRLKDFNIKKCQNLCEFHERELVYLAFIDLDDTFQVVCHNYVAIYNKPQQLIEVHQRYLQLSAIEIYKS